MVGLSRNQLLVVVSHSVGICGSTRFSLAAGAAPEPHLAKPTPLFARFCF
jgi:hypothetical protein